MGKQLKSNAVIKEEFGYNKEGRGRLGAWVPLHRCSQMRPPRQAFMPPHISACQSPATLQDQLPSSPICPCDLPQ